MLQFVLVCDQEYMHQLFRCFALEFASLCMTQWGCCLIIMTKTVYCDKHILLFLLDDINSSFLKHNAMVQH